MAPSDVTLGRLANALLADPMVRRAALVTAPSTGNPALAEIDLHLARNLVVVTYKHVEELDALHHSSGALDLVIVDPFHTYEASLNTLERCLNLLRPGGVLLCHDCVPPPEYLTPEFRRREWCGVTFAAFRDVMRSRSAAWCTLAADFGIGIAVAPQTVAGATAQDAPGGSSPTEESWTAETHDAYVARYLADPFGFMRTVCADEWRTAIERLLAHDDIGGTSERSGPVDLADLAAVHTSWDDVLPPDSLERRDARAAEAAGSVARRRTASVLCGRTVQRGVRVLRRALRRAAQGAGRKPWPQ